MGSKATAKKSYCFFKTRKKLTMLSLANHFKNCIYSAKAIGLVRDSTHGSADSEGWCVMRSKTCLWIKEGLGTIAVENNEKVDLG